MAQRRGTFIGDYADDHNYDHEHADDIDGRDDNDVGGQTNIQTNRQKQADGYIGYHDIAL